MLSPWSFTAIKISACKYAMPWKWNKYKLCKLCIIIYFFFNEFLTQNIGTKTDAHFINKIPLINSHCRFVDCLQRKLALQMRGLKGYAQLLFCIAVSIWNTHEHFSFGNFNIFSSLPSLNIKTLSVYWRNKFN